jgi:signal transduction histidine kinase
MSLSEAFTQLAETPGSMVYHLTLAMSLIVLISIAQIIRKNTSHPEATRWVFAGVSLLVLRLLVLLVDGLRWKEVFTSGTLLPSFDRFASLTGILVFAWVLELPIPKYSKYLLFGGSVFNLLVIFLLPNLLLSVEDTVPFNHSMIDAIWSFASLLLVIGATVTLVTLRPSGWATAIWSYAILTLGVLLHISQGPASASTAGYVHVAEIAAYPVFTIGAIYSLTDGETGRFISGKRSLDTLPSFEEIAFLEVAADLATTPISDDESQFERQVVEIIARGLKLDLSIMLMSNRSAGKVEVITGYDMSRGRPIPISSFDMAMFPELTKALQSGSYFQLLPEARKSELLAMDSVVGRKVGEPLHFFPMRSGREPSTGFLTSSPPGYPLNSPINQARMKEVVSILSKRLSTWQTEVIRQDGLLEVGLQDDAQFHLRQLEAENAQLEQALLALQQKVNKAELLGRGQDHSPQKANIEEIQRLEAEVVRLTSALVFKDDPVKDERMEQLISERQLALEELAAVRNSMAMMEQMAEREVIETRPREVGVDPRAFNKIAQELRRPMSAIQIYTDLLLNETVGILGTMQEKFLQRIKRATDRVGLLLQDLARIGPSEIAGLHIKQERVNLADCLDTAISMASERIKEKGMVLRIDIPEEHPAFIADTDTLIQILYHLLIQAISTSPNGGQIELITGEKSGEEQRFFTFSLRDSGERLPPDVVKELVQIADQSENMLPGKTDDDLLTVKNLVSMLGGRIWVERKNDTGNLVTVLFPLLEEPQPA